MFEREVESSVEGMRFGVVITHNGYAVNAYLIVSRIHDDLVGFEKVHAENDMRMVLFHHVSLDCVFSGW